MVRKAMDMKTESREKMRGGEGTVEVRHYFEPAEFGAKTRLCAKLTLPPGASIGEHAHVEEDEVYVILSGSGVVMEGECPHSPQKRRVSAGDAVLTGRGGVHAIANDGAEPLEIAAFVILYA